MFKVLYFPYEISYSFFLIKRSKGKISHICLAMKKRGFGVGRWNGVGGKVGEGESIEQATIRETYEEIGVKISEKDMMKVAELTFKFSKKSEWNQIVNTYLAEKWEGEPIESDEMNPKWFEIKNMPYDKMWPDDIYWLPRVIEGEFIKAQFTFGDNDIIEDKKIENVIMNNR